jgi:hypothetical protein
VAFFARRIVESTTRVKICISFEKRSEVVIAELMG